MLWSRVRAFFGGPANSIPSLTVSGSQDVALPDAGMDFNLTGSSSPTISTIAASQMIQPGRRICLTNRSTTAVVVTNNSATTTKGQMDLLGGDRVLAKNGSMMLKQHSDGSWTMEHWNCA